MHHVMLPMLFLAFAQEPNDAEKLFRAGEKKILAAETVQFSMLGTVNDSDEFKLTCTFFSAKGNKSSANLAFTFVPGDKSWRIQTVSDGVKTRLSAFDCGRELNNHDVYDTPHNLNATMIAAMFRLGMLGSAASYALGGPGDSRVEIDKAFTLSRFALGKKEKIKDREAQRIDYVISGPSELSYKTQIWLDTISGLPVKRVSSIPWDDKKFEITETYDIRINGKIDAKIFELPGDKRR